MNKVLAGLALGASMAIGGSQLAGADALAYPPADEEMFLSITVVTAGGTVTVTVRGCLVGETVRFTLGDVSVEVTCTAGGAGDARLMAAPGVGTATADLQAPSVPGVYTITAEGLTSGFTETATITVVGADDDDNGDDGDDGDDAGSNAAGGGAGNNDDAGSSLPSTGSDTNGTLWIAGGALTAGVALSGVALARRRRPAATA